MKLLLLEDDPILGHGLKTLLEIEKFQVNWAQNIKGAKSYLENEKYDVAIFDVGLPDGSGIDLCASVRKEGLKIPIIILTAQTDEDSVVKGLTSGANDYVKKPFSNKELIARLNVLTKPFVTISDSLKVGFLEMNIENRLVNYKGEEIKLNRKEFDLLKFFMERQDGVVTREMIIEQVLDNIDISDRTVDSHISHIRSKLSKSGVEDIKIISEYGIGYRLKLND